MQTEEKAQSTELAKVEQNEMNLLSKSMVDVSNVESIPDLKDAKEVPVDLSVEYWDPQNAGDELRGVFVGFITREASDFQNPEVLIELECALFLRKEDGKLRRYANAAKRLVSSCKTLPLNTACKIVYKGDVQNKQNAFKSQTFMITPLVINIPSK